MSTVVGGGSDLIDPRQDRPTTAMAPTVVRGDRDLIEPRQRWRWRPRWSEAAATRSNDGCDGAHSGRDVTEVGFFWSESLTLSNSRNIVIRGLSSVNSELYHIVILGCQNVTLVGMNIEAAGNSPNTDGVHVQMSKGVNILQSSIKTGDDCISIGPGTTALWIERIFCGPGHGISIGSLGKGGSAEQGVQNVTVKSVVFSGTENGLRIKTWGTKTQGFVKGVVFMNAVMQKVHNPIIIDQNYCDRNQGCPKHDQNSHIRVSNVRYVNIHGTSATKDAVNFNCSATYPCNGISMEDIKLTYGNNQAAQATCKNALGAASGLIVPKSCL